MMSRQIVREYLGTFAGRAPNTKRLALQPVLQTARFMHLEFEFPNIGERLGIGSKLKTPPKSVYLTDVVEFCDWLRERDSHLEAGACLQGLAGLQLLEVLRLTWDKVDLERGLVEISGEVKNEYRNRVVPVVDRTLEALRRADYRRRHRKGAKPFARDLVVVGVHGRPFVDSCSYGRQMKAAFRGWNPECDWAPKDLRNCLPTFAKMEGVHGTIWEQYIGHAPRGVTDRHYVPRLAGSTRGETGALVRQMNLFRRFVVEPVETAMEPNRPTCKILQLGELGA